MRNLSVASKNTNDDTSIEGEFEPMKAARPLTNLSTGSKKGVAP